MAVTLLSTGGLFVRLGAAFGRAADAIALKGGTATSRVTSGASLQAWGATIEGLAAESPAVSSELDGHWRDIAAAQQALDGHLGVLARRFQTILIRQVDLDANLFQATLLAALTELRRQMIVSSDDLNGSTVAIAAQTAVGSPTGNPVVVWSTKWLDGFVHQTMKPETIRATVSTSTQTGAVARQEQITLTGASAPTSVWDRDWHSRGSGASRSIVLCDAQANNAKGNKLYNSSFEVATTNTPEDWVITVGAAGTNVFRAADPYTGTYALQITGDAGGTLTELTQAFGTAHSTTIGAGGTPATLTRRTAYAFNCKIKRDNALSAGVLSLSLVDGSGTVINDDAGTANTVTQSLTALTASYTTFSGVFRTPSILPAVVKLRVKTSTAIDDGDSLFIDDLALCEMASFYSAGVSPMVAGFAGSVDPVVGDSWTFAATNTMGGLAMWMERFFGLARLGITLPYDDGGTETVADTLIV